MAKKTVKQPTGRLTAAERGALATALQERGMKAAEIGRIAAEERDRRQIADDLKVFLRGLPRGAAAEQRRGIQREEQQNE